MASPHEGPTQRGGRRPGLLALIAAAVLALGGASMVGYALSQQQHAPQAPAAAVEGSADLSSAPPAAVSMIKGMRGLVLPGAAPTAIRIPAIGVSSPVNQVGLNPDHSIEVPAPGPRYDQAAWYRYSPTPGQLGPAVILGHIDSARNGPSVFFDLAALRPGDRIEVDRADHTTATFVVDFIEAFPKDGFPTLGVYGDTDDAALRLITCGGVFDRAVHQYRDNTVAFAHLTGAGPARA